MVIQLPNGLIDGQDLFNYADIDELRGKQQNYLADRDLITNNLGHIPKILEDVVKSLQTREGLKWGGKMSDAIHKLPMGDLETILIKIRENTYGPKFYHEAKCEHCEQITRNLRLDLDQLALDVMPIEEQLKAKIVHLPKCGVNAELKPLYLKDLFEALKLAKGDGSKVITTSISVGIKRLGDKHKITPEDIDNIPSSDLLHLQDEMEKMRLEGSIDTNIEITCSKCSKDFSMKLGVFDPLFFAPTRASKNTNS